VTVYLICAGLSMLFMCGSSLYTLLLSESDLPARLQRFLACERALDDRCLRCGTKLAWCAPLCRSCKQREMQRRITEAWRAAGGKTEEACR
jgi:hypothetical protein